MTTTNDLRSATAAERGYHCSEMTYVGMRMRRTGKIAYAWLTEYGEDTWHGKNLVSNPRVGSVYEVYETTDGGSFVVGGVCAPRFLRITDHDDLATWSAQDETARAQLEAERARKRLSKDKPMGTMTLDDLTLAYQRLATTDQKAGMMAAIIRYLDRGRG